MTIRGLFLKHKSVSLTFYHQLQWRSMLEVNPHHCQSEQFLTLTWTSREPPRKSEPISADHPNLDNTAITDQWHTLVYLSIYHTVLYSQSFSLRGANDAHRPLDRVWGILLPVFGMYFPKVEDTVTRTKSTNNVTLIIFVDLLEDKEEQKEEKANHKTVWSKKEH